MFLVMRYAMEWCSVVVLVTSWSHASLGHGKSLSAF